MPVRSYKPGRLATNLHVGCAQYLIGDIIVPALQRRSCRSQSCKTWSESRRQARWLASGWAGCRGCSHGSTGRSRGCELLCVQSCCFVASARAESAHRAGCSAHRVFQGWVGEPWCCFQPRPLYLFSLLHKKPRKANGSEQGFFSLADVLASELCVTAFHSPRHGVRQLRRVINVLKRQCGAACFFHNTQKGHLDGGCWVKQLSCGLSAAGLDALECLPCSELLALLCKSIGEEKLSKAL